MNDWKKLKEQNYAKRAATAVAAALLIPGVSGCDLDLADFIPESAAEEGDASVIYNGLEMDEEEARAALGDFQVSAPRPMKGYSREKFPHWLSASKWGWDEAPDASDCDAREASLERDGNDVTINPSTCYPQSGTWTDPYTGESIDKPRDVDIDHVVPLASAWRAGADEWDEEKRTHFANSELSIIATGASSNREKGDKGPEVWKPDVKEAWCPYAIRWVAVKDEYDLDLTSADERAALTEMLDTCSDETETSGGTS